MNGDQDVVLLGFARALRAAGVPVTHDRAQTFLTAASVVGLDDRRADLRRRPGHPVLLSRRPGPLRPGLRGLLQRPRRAAAGPAGDAQRGDVRRSPAERATARAARHEDRRRRGAGAGQRDRGAPASRPRLAHRGREAPARRDVRRPCTPGRRCGVRSRYQRWHRGDVDASRTLRASLRRMGEPAAIEWRRRGTKPRRVVLLVDVSGSMSGYADALLRLAHRMVVASPRGSVEVFTVGTRLTHVTRALRSRDAERALVAAGETVPDWSGGTRLGETMRVFLDRWGRRGLARGSVVVVFSDGWERGDAALLGEQMTPAAPGRAPGRLGQPAPRASPATNRCSRVWSPRCRTATTSWPVTRWRRSPSWWRWWPVRDVLPELMKWWEAGETVGVGTVVATFQSAPRPAGASMLVGPDETAVGSVSGGCVEGAVYELAQSVVGGRHARAGALRRLRRRCLRGRSDLRRNPRRVRRAGLRRDFPGGELAPTSRPTSRSRSSR